MSEKSYLISDNHATFDKAGLIVAFYMFSLSEGDNDILNENNCKKATSVILLLLFHINNENIKTPRYYYNSNLKDFINNKIDTEFALQITLFQKIIDAPYFINREFS